MDIQKIRLDFPLLNEKNNRKPLVYFDNACQSLRPQSVIDSINSYYLEFPACGGRSMHRLAERVTHECEEARSIIAKFLNASRKEEIVFTRNTTEGINLVANSLGLKKRDAVLISDKEHNSNLIPWLVLAKKLDIEVRIVHSKEDNTFNLEEYEKTLNGKVKLVALGMTSNLDGVTIPAAEIIKLAHRNGSLVMLDAAQTVPHQKVDVRILDVDFLAFSGHKMLGPSGMGVLFGKYHLLEKLDPFMVGGDTVSYSTYSSYKFLPPPEKFEAGLQDYAGIIGLGEAVKYLQKVGFNAIQDQEKKCNELITHEVINFPRFNLVGPSNPELRGGVISFFLKGVDSHQIALMLDQMSGILVRSGQHCVHSWFNAHGITGSVRASLYFYNTLAEAELFVSQLTKITKVL
jgi:cysteine desulfurase / selenocysteine lyase